MPGFNDDADALIGSDTQDLTGRVPTSAEGFNDSGFGIGNEKVEVNGADRTQAAGFNDDDSIIDMGHMSG